MRLRDFKPKNFGQTVAKLIKAMDMVNKQARTDELSNQDLESLKSIKTVKQLANNMLKGMGAKPGRTNKDALNKFTGALLETAYPEQDDENV